MSKIRIVEVGPRDGLQNEALHLTVEIKRTLIDRLSATGLSHIEVGAFVSPRWVPQMADSGEVLRRIERRSGVTYPVLVPNVRGLSDAMRAGATEVAVFIAASEGFSRRNINCGIRESLERIRPVLALAAASGIAVRAYLSCVLGCPYDGPIDPGRVADLAAELLAMGCHEISLGDTIGTGTPTQARALVRRVGEAVPVGRLALHFHDTYGQALTNILVGLELGVTVIDSAVAGLGGCPYAGGTNGNVATEDLIYMLHGMGLDTGIDLDAMVGIGGWISHRLARPNGSKVGSARLRSSTLPPFFSSSRDAQFWNPQRRGYT